MASVQSNSLCNMEFTEILGLLYRKPSLSSDLPVISNLQKTAYQYTTGIFCSSTIVVKPSFMQISQKYHNKILMHIYRTGNRQVRNIKSYAMKHSMQCRSMYHVQVLLFKEQGMRRLLRQDKAEGSEFPQQSFLVITLQKKSPSSRIQGNLRRHPVGQALQFLVGLILCRLLVVYGGFLVQARKALSSARSHHVYVEKVSAPTWQDDIYSSKSGRFWRVPIFCNILIFRVRNHTGNSP